jgi:hypothetical protein
VVGEKNGIPLLLQIEDFVDNGGGGKHFWGMVGN